MTSPRQGWLAAAMVLLSLAAAAQVHLGPFGKQREFPSSYIDVKQALREMGAEDGAPLSALAPYVTIDPGRLSGYERPYCQYRLELVTEGEEKTLVRVVARITAEYTDPATHLSETRPLLSNGRLETELLDRLQARLQDKNPDLTAAAVALERQISELRARRGELEDTVRGLQAEIDELQRRPKPESPPPALAAVTRAGAVLMRQPQDGAPLFRAVKEDEFEVRAFRDDWVQVGLAGKAGAWMRRADLKLLPDDAPAAVPAAEPDFAVTREEVNVFMGDWRQLQGRRVLFLFARPLAVSSNARSREKKLLYAKGLFADRYRSAIHSDQHIEGVVVIFLGGGGGVAAATLGDIRSWSEGELPERVFLSRCSLDLPAAITP